VEAYKGLSVADQAVYQETGRHLSDLQREIFVRCWQGNKYKEIATALRYADGFIANTANELWQLLTEALGERVSKAHFKSVVERYWENLSPVSQPRQEEEPPLEPFYVERPNIEARCYATVSQPGGLVRIKYPKQMGKTWLLDQVLHWAKTQNFRVARLNFRLAERAIFSDLDTLLRWFCDQVRGKLGMPKLTNDYWAGTFGSKDNCTAYFEECLLPAADTPLVLGLDDVDWVFQYPEFAGDFFSLLRAWHEDSNGHNSTWAKLRMVIVYSSEVSIPLNINESPFNVGEPIELREFNAQEVYDLAQRYKLNWQENSIDQFMSIVKGHPYLVQRGLGYIAQYNIKLEELLQMAPRDNGPYGEHLRRLLQKLRQHPPLMGAFRKVVMANESVKIDPELEFQLYSLGLVIMQGHGIVPRCELYRQYFHRYLRDD
jgi:hypothetical protein